MSDTLDKFQFITILITNLSHTSTQDQWSLKNFCLLKPLVIQNIYHLKFFPSTTSIGRNFPAFQNTLSRMSLVKKTVEKNLWSL